MQDQGTSSMDTGDPAVDQFNAYWQTVDSPEQVARRAAERAEYEARYEAMMAHKRLEREAMTDQLYINDQGAIDERGPLTWDGEPLYSPATVAEGLFDPEPFEQLNGQTSMETDER